VYDECEEMSVDEIINGKEGGSSGLYNIIRLYLPDVQCEPETQQQLERYLCVISRRASGSLMTDAAWIRNFIREHPKYEQESRVRQEVCYDLMRAVDELERGMREERELLPRE